ncbi:unnamed protein product [Colias eurytheme]|nr:unnamed protein product [Colias eurytheme]
MRLIMLILAVTLCFTNGYEIKEKDISEARGKGKYALLTNLAILLAVKVGLYKIFLGIAFLIAAIKAMVIMAWSLAVFKYVPNNWTQKNDYPLHDKPQSHLFLDVILNNINRQSY